MGVNAETLLQAAATAVKDRAPIRDTVSGIRSMRRAIRTFNELHGTDLTESQGWEFMLILKLARAKQGAYNPDDYVDCSGYAALAGEAAFTENFEPAEPGIAVDFTCVPEGQD